MSRYLECKVCGRPLSAPKSVEAGIGPECRKKYSLYLMQDCLNPIWKPDFDYTLHGNTVLVRDLDRGGVSVTNSIEYVIATISKEEELDTRGLTFAYRDSEGQWAMVRFSNTGNIWFAPVIGATEWCSNEEVLQKLHQHEHDQDSI